MVQYPTREALEARVKILEEKLHRLGEVSENIRFYSHANRFKVLAEAAREGIFILEDGYCIEANQNGCKMFGYAYEEIIGSNAFAVFASDYQDLVKHKIETGDEETYEAIGVRKDGSEFFAEVSGKNWSYDGRKVRISSVVDISVRKKAEHERIESENKYREVIENAADGILIGNLRGEIIDVNKGFLKLTGFSQSEILNCHISVLFDVEALAAKPLRFDLLNKGDSIIIEREIVHKNGTRIPVEMNSKRPHANYYLTVIRDLSERHKAQSDLLAINKQLKIEKERAEVSDRLKTAFLANMSHEIRTPLNGVVGFADLLKSSDITANDWKSYLDIIVSSGQQLLCIINDVLAISKIETGQEHVEIQQIFLPVVFEEIQLFFQSMAADTHNDLVLKLPDDETSRYVMSDGGKIRQILTNLVNNALKFTRNGIVTFGYTRELQQVLFFVKDTGIGIPSTHISIIFDRFVQVENAAGGVEHPGTGLGLSICKKMVELMGGKIWVESKLNEGSVFYFALPL